MTTKNVLEKVQPKTFIQIGGFDGKTNDPLYDFLIKSEEIRGVILEPQPDKSKRGSPVRPFPIV